MKIEIKKYFEEPLTKGWFFEKALIVLVMVLGFMLGKKHI